MFRKKVNDPHHTKQYYKSIQALADASVTLCEEGKFKKLEQFLTVAWKLFKNGNETVKNGIVNIYLFTLSRVIDMRQVRKEILSRYAERA